MRWTPTRSMRPACWPRTDCQDSWLRTHAGTPVDVLPASQVVRLLVPAYVQEDPSLAGVLNESMADRIADKLGGKSVRAVLPKPT